MIVPVILCGGAGTRLWPLSRRLYPKQFHCLTGGQSLLQLTALRAREVSGQHALLVVTNEDQKFLVADQLQNVRELSILVEPEPRNTAPAIALAACFAARAYVDPVLLVMPSDHLISDNQAFAEAVGEAEKWARRGRMVTFGIRPTKAETGYGYIERGADISTTGAVFEVERFVEKPDEAAAERLFRSGTHWWNSGIFMFEAAAYLRELDRFSPDILKNCGDAMAGAAHSGEFIEAAAQSFKACPSISIDYAVMERTDAAVVVPFAGGWSDIGSWRGLEETIRLQGDAAADQGDGNVTRGEVYMQDVTGSYIHAAERLVAAVGVKDTIIVDTGDAVLVADKNSDQKIKGLVEQMRLDQRQEVQHHTRVYRPWGSYQTLEQGAGFQVKRLVIKPGASISLQLHRRRSEHWVVVAGEAQVTNGDRTFILKVNESTYIPVGTVHKLENLSPENIEIIEVQTGAYLGEDDIERFEDKYGRT